MSTINYSKNLFSLISEILHCLDQNIWTDLIYQLHPNMKDLVAPSETTGQFKCLVCLKHRSSHSGIALKSLLRHFSVNYHLNNMRKEDLTEANNEILELFTQHLKLNIDDFQYDFSFTLESPSKDTADSSVLNESIEEIRLKFIITQFILSKRLPFNISQDLMQFIQTIVASFSKNTILNCHLNRNQVTNIATKCISRNLQEELFQELRLSPFSLMIDTGSDYYGTSYISVCAKFIAQENTKEPVTKLLSVLKVGEESTGNALYQEIKDSILKDENISRNFIAVCTDQGPNMAGPEKGLAKILQDNFPHTFAVNDLSHIYNLICKNAVKTFPKKIIDSVKCISSHFKQSNQEKVTFKKLQQAKGIKNPLEVLPYTKNRWLSLTESLGRIIKLWESLNAYFINHGEQEEKEIFTVENELYARNMLTLLEQLTHYNVIFQANNMRYDDMLFNLNESSSVFCNEIMVNDDKGKTIEYYLQLPWDKETEVEKHLVGAGQLQLLWAEMYPETKALFSKVDANILNSLFGATRDFIIKIVKEMKTRLPLTKPILQASLAVFFNSETFDLASWQVLSNQIKNIISEDENRPFQNELKRMSCNYARHTKEHISSNRKILETWRFLANQYPSMSKLAQAVLVLPHSSCSVERVFSQLEDFMTPKRSRLTTENLEACLLIHQSQEFGGYNFELTQNMITCYRALGKKKETELNIAQNNPNSSKMDEEKVIEVPESRISNKINVEDKSVENVERIKKELIDYFSGMMIKTPEREEPKHKPVHAEKNVKEKKKYRKKNQERVVIKEEEKEKDEDEDEDEEEEQEEEKPKQRRRSGRKRGPVVEEKKSGSKQVKKRSAKK